MRMRRAVRGAFLLILVALFAVAQPVQAQDGDLRVTVTQVDGSEFPLVRLFVSVTNGAGTPLAGLQQGELTVTEDGKPVEILTFEGGGGGPISTLLVVDRSGSMKGAKLRGAKEAARTFVGMMRPQDQVGLLLFDDRADLTQPLTGDESALRRAIDDVEIGGATALYDAVIEGIRVLEPIGGRKSLIVLSDGADNRDDPEQWADGNGSRHPLSDAVAQAGQGGVTLYTIGLGERGELNEDALRQLAEPTGGTYFRAPSADDLAVLYHGLGEQFQTEYAVTYRSPRATYDGTRRGIAVQVAAQGGQTAAAAGSYMERHLLQVRSTVPVALVLSALLLAAIAGPLLLRRRAPVAVQGGVGAVALSGAAGTYNVPIVREQDPPAGRGRTCGECGKALRPTARFCPACGQGQA